MRPVPTPPGPKMTRRALLGAAALLPLAGCGTETVAPRRHRRRPPVHRPIDTRPLRRLERRYDATLGVYAVNTGTGATVAHRADQRFNFCSTFKGLAAAAILARHPLSYLDKHVTFTAEDLMASSVITRSHVATGMTLRQACDAAVRYSDGTAANLLLRELGGPDRLTAYTRRLGDRVFRMDSVEPGVAERTPGSLRNTTSPRAIGTDYREIILGDALPAHGRAFLRDLMERNTTGDERIRAGLPHRWTVADKTGTGDYGAINDIAIARPPRSAPLVIAVMSRRSTEDARHDESLIASTATFVAGALT
jgi:beta-lactamase class A